MSAGGHPLRLLFATTHTYLPQRAGGVESSTHDLCRELARRGDETAVLARLGPEGWLGLITRIRRKLPFGSAFPVDRRMGYPVFRGWHPAEGLAEVSQRFGPDVVVVQGTAPVPLVRAVVEFGLPTVFYFRDVEFERLGGKLPEDCRLLLLANSEFTAGRVHRDLGLEARVLPPLIRPGPYETRSSGEKVLYVNPHPWKGVETAFALAERRPDIPFVFLESWKLSDEVKSAHLERAAALPNVEWRERIEDMREMYRLARLVLVPSQWEEAWGRVVSEAQVSGIPALASDRGGLPESVGPGGILVDPDGPLEAWVEALGRIWDDRREYERLSRAALEHARRPDIQPETLISRFRELLAAHAREHAQAQPHGGG